MAMISFATQFWADPRECRLGAGALDFGCEEVRKDVGNLIEEAVRRYDCDGIELDFNRFPTFLPRRRCRRSCGEDQCSRRAGAVDARRGGQADSSVPLGGFPIIFSNPLYVACCSRNGRMYTKNPVPR